MKKNNTFIKQAIYSIKNFDKYKEFKDYKLSTSFIYFFVLIAIYTTITTIGIVHNIRVYAQNAKEFVDIELSEFNYTNRAIKYK